MFIVDFGVGMPHARTAKLVVSSCLVSSSLASFDPLAVLHERLSPIKTDVLYGI
jgi:hypothetical protein